MGHQLSSGWNPRSTGRANQKNTGSALMLTVPITNSFPYRPFSPAKFSEKCRLLLLLFITGSEGREAVSGVEKVYRAITILRSIQAPHPAPSRSTALHSTGWWGNFLRTFSSQNDSIAGMFGQISMLRTAAHPESMRIRDTLRREWFSR